MKIRIKNGIVNILQFRLSTAKECYFLQFELIIPYSLVVDIVAERLAYNIEYPYKGFLLECCRNDQFIYFEDCELYNNCTLGQDCPVYEQCGYWENRQQRAFADRKLARTVRTSTYARQLGRYLSVRVMTVAELPEMNPP